MQTQNQEHGTRTMTERHVYTEDLKDQRLYEGYKEEIHTTY